MKNATPVMAHAMTVRPKPHRYRFVRGIGRFTWARECVCAVVRLQRRSAWAAFQQEQVDMLPASMFDADAVERFNRELSEDGFSLGLRLPPDVVTELQSFAEQAPCFADRDPGSGFTLAQRSAAERSVGKPILLAECFDALARCPAIGRIAADPLVQLIAGRHLDSAPTLVGTSLWWTFPVAASRDDRMHHAHFFHRDVDDFRFVKFFFYLSDVGHGDGGHVIVRRSHRQPPFIRLSDRIVLRRYDDAEIALHYGDDRIVEVVGAAGTGFVENTLCVHKGLTPVSRARLLLQLEFALFDYGLSHDARPDSELRSIVSAEAHP